MQDTHGLFWFCLQPGAPAVCITIHPQCPPVRVVLCCVPLVRGSHDKIIWTIPRCMPFQVSQHYVPDVRELHSWLIQMTTAHYLAVWFIQTYITSTFDREDILPLLFFVTTWRSDYDLHIVIMHAQVAETKSKLLNNSSTKNLVKSTHILRPTSHWWPTIELSAEQRTAQ